MLQTRLPFLPTASWTRTWQLQTLEQGAWLRFCSPQSRAWGKDLSSDGLFGSSSQDPLWGRDRSQAGRTWMHSREGVTTVGTQGTTPQDPLRRCGELSLWEAGTLEQFSANSHPSMTEGHSWGVNSVALMVYPMLDEGNLVREGTIFRPPPK